MEARWLFEELARCRLLVSVQTADSSPLDDPATLGRLALASTDSGVRILRLQGVDSIRYVRSVTGAPCIGLIKRDYAGSQVYITPTAREVRELSETGCEIIALDGTDRRRPTDERLADLISLAHKAGKLVLADIDSVASAQGAVAAGADLLSTTLAGYTDAPSTRGADLELLRTVVQTVDVPVFGEGRFEHRWEVEAALRIGAAGVIVGGAVNDPLKNTRRLLPSFTTDSKVGAVDIGGTWLRFAAFSPDWKLGNIVRTPNPPRREDRIAWIRAQIADSGVSKVGVSSGGIIDPQSGECWTAKEYLMPDQIGIRFDQSTLGVPTFAHGDGHATAWGHANLPEFAGRRVATLALGTGVGCGFVESGRIWRGRRGEYPRINDLPGPGGHSYEDLLGGINLTRTPSSDQIESARLALRGAVAAIRNLYFPDDLIIAGSVGMADWLAEELDTLRLVRSPFGADAGLYGAAALALFPVH